MYFIKEGIVRQYFLDKEGKERTILVLAAGDLLGEVDMLQGGSHLVFTEALTNCVLNKINYRVFQEQIRENSDLAEDILMMITTKFRNLLYQLYDASYNDTRSKTINLLRRLSVPYGIPSDKGIRLNLSLTHDDIAKMVNSTRSTITRLMNQLKKDQLILNPPRAIILLPPFFSLS